MKLSQISGSGPTTNIDDGIEYVGGRCDESLKDQPTPDFGTKWKKYKIGDPPKNSSVETRRELQKIKRYISNIDKEKREEINKQDRDDLEEEFFELLESLEIEYSEKLHSKIVDLTEQLTTIGLYFKDRYNRARPKQLLDNGSVKLIKGGKTAKSPSYPSTHAIIGRFIGKVLSGVYPEASKELTKLGHDLGLNRVIAGYHFDSDMKAGIKIADMLYQDFTLDAHFS